LPTSLQSADICSPASRRATNCSLSSITEHSFQGMSPPPQKGRKCNPCVRYDLLPMSQAAQRTYIIFENPVLLVSRTVTNPSQIVESIANALRINGINATILMLILRVLE